MRLKDKVAVITGAASGIGRETCLLFAEQGAKVVGVDINEKEGAETIRKIHDNGGQALFFKADVSKAANCKNMIDTAVVQYGRLDILFNNAGIMHSKDDDAVNTEEEVFDLKKMFRDVIMGVKDLKDVLERRERTGQPGESSFHRDSDQDDRP